MIYTPVQIQLALNRAEQFFPADSKSKKMGVAQYLQGQLYSSSSWDLCFAAALQGLIATGVFRTVLDEEEPGAAQPEAHSVRRRQLAHACVVEHAFELATMAQGRKFGMLMETLPESIQRTLLTGQAPEVPADNSSEEQEQESEEERAERRRSEKGLSEDELG